MDTEPFGQESWKESLYGRLRKERLLSSAFGSVLYFMGELIKIAEYLQTKYYPQYCWVEERVRFSPIYTDIYLGFLEDGHGYSMLQ